jgi:simple sugar transport system ATP-binding protein/ribose transport system ATP-binding protein
LARALTGAVATSSGDVRLHGKKVAIRSPRHALRRGVVMIPESRKEQGLVLQRAIVENITLANLDTYSRSGLVARRREQTAVRRVLERVQVKAPALSAPIAGLSGGNQQKALFARALLCSPSVLLADEPTRGVDVGSRRAIYDLIVEQARAGVGVIVISSDVEEVLGLAHRVLVIRGGRVAAELTGDQMTEENVLHAAFAEVNNDPSQEPGGATDD